MPLPPNASITDVIDKLTELEGINQKTELASVIGSPALSTDTVAQQIVKLQTSKNSLAANITNKGVTAAGSESIQSLATKVSQIPLGKKVVSGTVNSDNNSSSYQRYNNTNGTNFYSVTVANNFGFVPSKIEIYPNNITLTTSTITNYYKTLRSLNEFVTVNFLTGNTEAYSAYGLKGNTGYAYVNATGFRLPTLINNAPHTWVAYE